MNEKIRKKLNIPVEKVPYCLRNFGNTSCATIPLTLATQCSDLLIKKEESDCYCIWCWIVLGGVFYYLWID